MKFSPGFLCALVLLFSVRLCVAQTQLPLHETGSFSGPYTQPLSHVTEKNWLVQPQWHVRMDQLPNEIEDKYGQIETLKTTKNRLKRQQLEHAGEKPKTRGNAPQIGKNFKGNELKSWTPTDNTIAVSAGGKIVSCINQGIEVYDTSGNAYMVGVSWDAFVNDSTLNQAKFDPRVIYDAQHDRFIIVLLHGFSSDKSKILACFSKTNNPMDGWYIYKLSGNPYNDSSWTDYPTTGISKQELFINGNRWGDAAQNYPFHGTFLYQIGLDAAYQGNPLQFGLWNNIYTSDGQDGLTLYPASDGQGHYLDQQMYFVQLMPDSGSHIYVYELNGSLLSPNKSMHASQYSIPHYEVCGDAFEKDPGSGLVDSLSTGSAWTQNAFYLNRMLHVTFDADISGGWCGLHYARVYLDSGKAVVTSWGQSGTDWCYPAVASLGYDTLDRSVAIAFVGSDTARMPCTAVISVDHTMNWSSMQTVKAGDTSVNILYPPDYPQVPERWGDYTGICRYTGSGKPQVWMAGAYGANTPPRMNSYATWIAQIITADAQVTGLPDYNPTTDVLIYPNPVEDRFVLQFENPETGRLQVELTDMSGRRVKVLYDEYTDAGKHWLSFNKLMLPNGQYMLSVYQNGNHLRSEPLLIAR